MVAVLGPVYTNPMGPEEKYLKWKTQLIMRLVLLSSYLNVSFEAFILVLYHSASLAGLLTTVDFQVTLTIF